MPPYIVTPTLTPDTDGQAQAGPGFEQITHQAASTFMVAMVAIMGLIALFIVWRLAVKVLLFDGPPGWMRSPRRRRQDAREAAEDARIDREDAIRDLELSLALMDWDEEHDDECSTPEDRARFAAEWMRDWWAAR